MGKILVDQAVLGDLAQVYREQSEAATATRGYVETYCRLDGAIGLLLSMLKDGYTEGRDSCMAAFDAVAGLTGHLAQALDEYAQEASAADDHVSSMLEPVEAGVQQAGGGGPSGATAGGAGRGSSWTGGDGSLGGDASGTVASGAGSAAASGQDGVAVSGQGNVAAGGQGNVAVGGQGNVAASGERAATASGDNDVVTTGDGNVVNTGAGVQIVVGDGSNVTVTLGGPSGDAAAAGPPAPTQPDVDAAQHPAALDDLLAILAEPRDRAPDDLTRQAQEAESYHRIWAELAAKDPLGRSAEELCAAWEAREPLTLDPAAAAELGSPAATPVPEALAFPLVSAQELAAARAHLATSSVGHVIHPVGAPAVPVAPVAWRQS